MSKQNKFDKFITEFDDLITVRTAQVLAYELGVTFNVSDYDA